MVRAALSGTALAGRPVRAWQILDTASDVVAVSCSGGEVRSVWTAARSVLATTGRWPVVVASSAGAEVDSGDEVVFSRVGYEPPGGPGHLELFGGQALADTAPEAVIARARTLTVEAAMRSLRRTEAMYCEPAAEYLASHLQHTRLSLGAAPSAEDVLAGVGRGATVEVMERWLYDWELARFGRAASPWPGPVTTTFAPTGPCAVLFLPTPDSWNAVAYLSYFGAWRAGHEELSALMREWHRRYGAELVAHWGTMLEFTVDRPPVDADAWELGTQISLVAQSLQQPIRHIAADLLTTHSWFLHERP